MDVQSQGIDWEMFWQAASAIATTAAVIVALWQTGYQNKKKLKIKFVENMTYLPNTGRGKVVPNRKSESVHSASGYTRIKWA